MSTLAAIPQHTALMREGYRAKQRLWASEYQAGVVHGGISCLKHSIATMVCAFNRENRSCSPQVSDSVTGLLLENGPTYLLTAQGMGLAMCSERCERALQVQVTVLEQVTHTGLHPVLAVCYREKQDRYPTVKQLIQPVQQSRLSIGKITPVIISCVLNAPGLPEPAVLICSRKEQRLSHFLLWQWAYAQLLGPDCDAQAVDRALPGSTQRHTDFDRSNHGVTGQC